MSALPRILIGSQSRLRHIERPLTVRRSMAAVSLLVALSLSAGGAQEFPAKPITLIVPFAAGGASDLILRAFIDTAPTFLGQPIVVQIRAGGGGAIASELVGQAKPDGYTLHRSSVPASNL